jgi:hypothetical protein
MIRFKIDAYSWFQLSTTLLLFSLITSITQVSLLQSFLVDHDTVCHIPRFRPPLSCLECSVLGSHQVESLWCSSSDAWLPSCHLTTTEFYQRPGWETVPSVVYHTEFDKLSYIQVLNTTWTLFLENVNFNEVSKLHHNCVDDDSFVL